MALPLRRARALMRHKYGKHWPVKTAATVVTGVTVTYAAVASFQAIAARRRARDRAERRTRDINAEFGLDAVALAAAEVAASARRRAMEATAANASPGQGVAHVVDIAPGVVVHITRDHPAMRYGYPSYENLKFRDTFVASYDRRMRNARWVAETLTPADVRSQRRSSEEESASADATKEAPKSDAAPSNTQDKHDATRSTTKRFSGSRGSSGATFHEELTTPPLYRAHLHDYRFSGYDRGHLAPAANHRHNAVAYKSTFSLVNVSPQAGKGFNRHYWARLEQYGRELAKRFPAVYIVTGPLWLPRPIADASATPAESAETTRTDGDAPQSSGDVAKVKRTKGPAYEVRYKVIGDPPNVAVPTHFFKAFLVEVPPDTHSLGDTHDKQVETVAIGAFVLPNAPISPSTPLTQFEVPLEMCEHMSGLTLFERVPRPPRAEVETDSDTAEELPRHGARGDDGFAARALPLCTVTKCELPEPDFWQKRRQAHAASNSIGKAADNTAAEEDTK